MSDYNCVSIERELFEETTKVSKLIYYMREVRSCSDGQSLGMMGLRQNKHAFSVSAKLLVWSECDSSILTLGSK